MSRRTKPLPTMEELGAQEICDFDQDVDALQCKQKRTKPHAEVEEPHGVTKPVHHVATREVVHWSHQRRRITQPLRMACDTAQEDQWLL